MKERPLIPVQKEEIELYKKVELPKEGFVGIERKVAEG